MALRWSAETPMAPQARSKVNLRLDAAAPMADPGALAPMITVPAANVWPRNDLRERLHMLMTP